MKIIFDFDGVITDQTEEALRVREIFFERVISSAQEIGINIKPTLDNLTSELNQHPEMHGWMFNEQITAYSDEDLFVWNNAFSSFLDEKSNSDNELMKIQKKLASEGFHNFKYLANIAFEQVVQETKAGTFKPIDPVAIEALQELLIAGHLLVIVSNSSTDRIIDLLQKHGLSAKDHEDNPKAPMRVRGGARKFQLDDAKIDIAINNRNILVNRPLYQSVLLEEMPDMVVGDVFSLDLALPLYLSSQEKISNNVKLLLRVRDYTPKWIINAIISSEKNIELFKINSLADIGPILTR